MASNGSFSAFHAEEDLAVCTSNGVLQLWNVTTGERKIDYTPTSHLTSSFTCLSWKIQQKIVRKKQSGSASKRKVKAVDQDANEEAIALGTATGEILLFDVKSGKVTGKFENEHTDKVNCICWDPNDRRLLSCSEDQHIVHWDVTSYKSVCKWQADKRGVSRICIAPHSTLLSAGKTIKLWDLKTRVLLRRFIGHKSSVLSLLFINPPPAPLKKDATPLERAEGLYFLSAAVEDRTVSVWQVQGKHKKIAVVSFSLNSEPVSMSVQSPKSKDKPITLMVVTDSGELNIFSHTLNGQMKKPLDVQMTVTVVDPSAKKLHILSATFCKDSESETATILIAYGTTIKIVFERVNLDDYTTKDVVLIRQNPMKISVTMSEHAVKTRQPIRNQEEVTTLAPGVPGHSQNSTDMIQTDYRAKRKKTKLNDTPLTEAEMTMEERLAALSEKKPESEMQQTAKTDSLGVLLAQGLQSNDRDILNKVLSHTNPTLIHNTVSRLPLNHVITLIQDLSNRIKTSPVAAVKLVKWLQETLKVHSSYLMTFPDLVPMLSKLYQIMDARTEAHSKFVKLEGKLELLASQIQSKKNAAENINIDTSPLFVYEDESSDEQEDILLDDLPEDNSESSDASADEWEDWDGMETDRKDKLVIDEDETDSGVAYGMMEED